MKKETMKIDLHVYRNILCDFIHCTANEGASPEYILIAEPIEVEVTLKPQEELISEEIKIIDREIEKEMEEVLKRIEMLKGRKMDLLSLGEIK